MVAGRLKYFRSRFTKGYKYLVHDGDHVRLATENDVLGFRDGPVLHIHLEKQSEEFWASHDEDAEFLPQQIQALAGITYRQLNTWIERGLLEPVADAGKTRKFSGYDAFVARLLGKFRSQGATMEVVERFGAFLCRNPELKR
jgi:hypothetical protein